MLNKTLKIQATFNVDEKLYESKDKNQSNKIKELIASCLKGNVEPSEIALPPRAGIQVPPMQVAFLIYHIM